MNSSAFHEDVSSYDRLCWGTRKRGNLCGTAAGAGHFVDRANIGRTQYVGNMYSTAIFGEVGKACSCYRHSVRISVVNP